MVFNDVDSIYTYIYESDRKFDCLACSNIPRNVPIDDPNTFTLENFITFLCESPEFQMKSPGNCLCVNIHLVHINLNMHIKYVLQYHIIMFYLLGITTIIDGKNKTLYMSNVKSIEERTRSNLTLSFVELNLKDGQELMVADHTTPNTILLKLKYKVDEVEML